MAIATGGRVAMKATSRAAKRRVQKMPALEKALTPAQRANKERKVAARQASKARRRDNEEAWRTKQKEWVEQGYPEYYDLYPHIDNFRDQKITTKITSRFMKSDPKTLPQKNPAYNMQIRPTRNREIEIGQTRAFSPEDYDVITALAESRGVNTLEWLPDDRDAKMFSRIIDTLGENYNDTALEAFRRLLPTWGGSVEELIGLIKLGVL